MPLHGFLGRTAIYEVAKITEEFRRLVVERVAGQHPQALGDQATGCAPCATTAGPSARPGITTIEEVLRVTMEDEIMMISRTSNRPCRRASDAGGKSAAMGTGAHLDRHAGGGFGAERRGAYSRWRRSTREDPISG